MGHLRRFCVKVDSESNGSLQEDGEFGHLAIGVAVDAARRCVTLTCVGEIDGRRVRQHIVAEEGASLIRIAPFRQARDGES